MYTSTATSVSGTVSAGLLSSSASSSAKLVRLLNGEYTASSVLKDQSDALRLGLAKLADGNFGVAPSRATAGAVATSSSSVLSALHRLTLGGA